MGLGWGQKVDGHMPWGALSGSRRVRGHERVFGGLCGGFRTPVVQYLQHMQILIIYLHLHTYRIQQNTDGSLILIRYKQIPFDTCRYMHIPTPKIYLHIHAIPTYTYIYLRSTYLQIGMWTHLGVRPKKISLDILTYPKIS